MAPVREGNQKKVLYFFMKLPNIQTVLCSLKVVSHIRPSQNPTALVQKALPPPLLNKETETQVKLRHLPSSNNKLAAEL